MKRAFSFKDNKGILYLVATPIGNLDEFSIRAQKVCNEASLIACEDTRNTQKLLSFFNIKKHLFSLHEHNEKEASNKVIETLKDNKIVCYLSDAGYPGISDPGSILVKEALDNGFNVSIINGSSAFLTALLASGLDTNHFYFEGFLDAKPSKAKSRLEKLKDREETLIFYESPHRISKTLSLLFDVLGDRKISVGRELTKIHEEYIRGTLSEVKDIDESTLIGEMVLIVEGNSFQNEFNEEDILNLLKENSNKYSGRDLVDYISNTYNLKRNLVYSIFRKTLNKKN